MTATFLAANFVFCFWGLANKLIDAAVFSILLGMLAGAIFCLPASGVAYIIPEESKDGVGIWTGMMWTPCAPFALAGPPLAVITRGGEGHCGYWKLDGKHVGSGGMSASGGIDNKVQGGWN